MKNSICRLTSIVLLGGAALFSMSGPLLGQSAVSSGARIAGAIAPIGDVDAWQIQVESGTTLRVGVGEISGTDFEPLLRLTAPGGNVVASNSGSFSADVVHTASIGGNYTVELLDGSFTPDGTADYEIFFTLSKGPFSVSSGDEGGVMTSGERHSGTVDLGDMDLYSFEASAGQTIRLGVGKTTGTAFRPSLFLYGPEGNFIESNGGTSSADVVAIAPVGGSYTVVVQDGNADVTGTGDYELHLSILGRDFTTPSGDEGGTITSGERRSGAVDLGDMDLYSFEASAGQTIRLGVGKTTGTAFRPSLFLYGPEGNFIESNGGTSSADVVAIAPVGGSYTVVVQDGNADVTGTGDYELHLSILGRDFTTPSGDEGGTMTSGERRSGTVDLGDMDLYSFEASAGQTIRLGVGKTTGTAFRPSLFLYGPEGNFIASNGGTSSADVVAIAPVGGSYTVVVQDGNADVTGTGDYELHLSILGRDFTTPSGDEGGPITSGEQRNGTVDLGDMDLYSFEANAGDQISASAQETSGTGFSPAVLLYGPDGSFVVSDTDVSLASISTLLSIGGRYTLLVQDGNVDVSGSGGYSLSFTRVPGGTGIPSGSNAGSITNGGFRDGTIGFEGDVDRWTFSVTEGETVYVQLAEISGVVFSPALSVFDPTGAPVALDSGSTSAAVSFRASTGGTFTAVVREAGDDSTGDYRLFLARSAAGFSTSVGDEGGALANGANEEGTITLGDMDLWDFEVAAGEPVWLQLGELTGVVFSPFVAVYDPSGNLVARDTGSSSASVFFRPTQSGTYRAVVRESGGDATGSYRLHLARSPAAFTVGDGDEGGTLANGANEEGTITLGDMDLWDFEVAAGEPVWLQLGELTGVVFSPFVAVYDPSGNLVARDTGSSSASVFFRPEQSGTYRAVVRASGGDATGSYRLHLARSPAGFTVGDGDEGGTLANGANEEGTITLGDMDLWDFEVGAGEPVWLQLGELTGVVFSPFVAVYDPSGNLVARDTGSSSASVFFRPEQSGTYRAVVRESGGDATGSYRLHLARSATPFAIPNLDDGGGIQDGMTVDGSITLGDIDQWGFHARAGDTVNLSLVELTGSVFSPFISVFGPDGETVAISTGSSTATIDFEAFRTGRYTVVVRENGGDSSGTYQLSASGMTSEAVSAQLRQLESLTPGRLLLEWPSPSQGWVLEESLTLQPGTWSESTVTPSDNGFRKSVEIDTTAGQAFFRLAKP